MSQSDPGVGHDAPAHVSRHENRIEKRIAKARDWSNAELVGRTIAIARPRAEVYAFWRDFANLARFMENIERVDAIDAKRSHWVVKAPGDDNSVEWDAILTHERENEALGWESAPDADIKHAGRVDFRDGPPGRGTEIQVVLAYEAPAGSAGKLIAKFFQKEPQIQARRDLRRLKQLLETGEISTTETPAAAPRAKH
jgi:uncharacterized membrane protein